MSVPGAIYHFAGGPFDAQHLFVPLGPAWPPPKVLWCVRHDEPTDEDEEHFTVQLFGEGDNGEPPEEIANPEDAARYKRLFVGKANGRGGPQAVARLVAYEHYPRRDD